jgi:hypothetical protein
MWTIHDLEVLFHHYCSTAPWPRPQYPAYEASLRKLWVYGLIDSVDDKHVTPKGCALINIILKTPLPEQGWFDPRVTETAA